MSSTPPPSIIALDAGTLGRQPVAGARAADAIGETNRAVERVVRLFVDRRRIATPVAASALPAGPIRSFREPLLLPPERAGPGELAEATAAAPRPGTRAQRRDCDGADPAQQSTCHRGSSCPS
jgi:hypothetical protein